MFKYFQFDLIKTKKSYKFKFLIISFIIIILLLYNIYINNDTKDDVKIISTNSRRIINNLNNYTETMSDFMVSNINDIELTEIQSIRLSIDYFKQLKEQEIKEKELKDKELKDKELKEKELKEIREKELKEKELKEIKDKELKEIREKAINLIKSYIPEFNSLINLVSTHQIFNNYVGDGLDISCIKEIIKINSEEIFNKLINIDYDKLEVSFNYLDKNEEYYKNTDNIITTHLYTDYDKNNQYYNYSHYIYRNFKENIIKNPIYKNIKDKLEIDYSYTEPNPVEEYNNKSKYFSRSLNDFKETLNNYYLNWEKYFENYTDDTYYLYLKDIYIGYNRHDYFTEFIINNEIIINNLNPIDIYNKHPYKYICNIPSKTINNKPNIINNYDYTHSMFLNIDYRGHTTEYICSNLENTLNIDINSYVGGISIRELDKNSFFINGNGGFHYFYNIHYYNNIKNNIYELEKNKGSRMIKHNLNNNFELGINNNERSVRIYNHYFIEKIFINFPLIFIYDEYEYIEKILNNYRVDIYNLPIIPPIKIIKE